jgi:hypothetical protein
MKKAIHKTETVSTLSKHESSRQPCGRACRSYLPNHKSIPINVSQYVVSFGVRKDSRLLDRNPFARCMHRCCSQLRALILGQWWVVMLAFIPFFAGCSNPSRSKPSPAASAVSSGVVSAALPRNSAKTAPKDPAFAPLCGSSVSRLETNLQWSNQRSAGECSKTATLDEITQFSHLKNLDLAIIEPVSLRPLASLKKLESLSLRLELNNRAVLDLQPLVQIKSLRELTLTSIGTIDMHSLSGLVQLERLNLNLMMSDSAAKNLVEPIFVRHLTNLVELKAATCSQTTLQHEISQLSQLRVLDVSSQMMGGPHDLTPLANLNNLEELTVGGGNYNDLTPLKKLSKLKLLSLSCSPHSNISALYPLKHLKRVEIMDSTNKNLLLYRQLIKSRPDIKTEWHSCRSSIPYLPPT